MGEGEKRAYPYVVWLQKARKDDMRHRVVAMAPGKFHPEIQAPNDAMGNEAWVVGTWHEGWFAELAEFLLCKLERGCLRAALERQAISNDDIDAILNRLEADYQNDRFRQKRGK